VQLDGTGSYDPDGDPLTFRWAFVERPQTSGAELDDPTSPRPTFVADYPGVYVLELRVEDGRGGADTDSVTVTARERPAAGEGEGQLLALKFVRLEFRPPEAWDRRLEQGCVVYTNASGEPATLTVGLPDGTAQVYAIPPGNEVIVCGDVVHVDARLRPQATVHRLEP